jgi:DNA-binding MarR family transcriptional regulator
MTIDKNPLLNGADNEHQRAIANIITTNYFLINAITDEFKKYDLTRQQYYVLCILRDQYPGHSTVNLIKDKMLDKMSDVSRIVERLRIKDLITRENSSDDKRCVQVRITAKGLHLLSKIDPNVRTFEKLVKNLSHVEALQLNDLLNKIRGSQETLDNKVKTNSDTYQESEKKISTLASLKM